MNTQIQIFDFNKIQLRVELDDNGNPLFCAKDVCDILGYLNSRKAISDHCREAGVTNRYIGVVTGKKADGTDSIQKVEMAFLDECNLYRLILRSNKPEAKPFETRLCDEILPSIRKTGGYNQDKQLEYLLNEVIELRKLITDKPQQIALPEQNKSDLGFNAEQADLLIVDCIEKSGLCSRTHIVKYVGNRKPFHLLGKEKAEVISEHIGRVTMTGKIKKTPDGYFTIA